MAAADEELGLPPLAPPKLTMSATEPVGHSAISINFNGPTSGPPLASSTSAPAPMTRANSDTAIAQRKMEQEQQLRPPRTMARRVLQTLTSISEAPAAIPQLAVESASLLTATFYCQICMYNEPLSNGFTLPCKHTFCKECITQYVQIKVREAQVERFVCPFIDDHQVESAPTGWACQTCTFVNERPANYHDGMQSPCAVCGTRQAVPPPEEEREPGCHQELDENVLGDLLDDEYMAKYKRFKDMKENRHYRECPKCQTANVQGPTLFSNQLTCEQCSYRFCYVHSDAHPGQACRQYERAHRIEERAANTHIAQFTRKCPKCKQPIEKNGGCNHMTCPTCKTDFCWLCGRRISGGTYPTHYAWWNIFGCPGTQMSEDLRSGMGNYSSAGMMCGWRLLYFIMLVVGGSCALAIVATAVGVWFAFGCLFLLCIPCALCADGDEGAANVLKCACAPILFIVSGGNFFSD